MQSIDDFEEDRFEHYDGDTGEFERLDTSTVGFDAVTGSHVLHNHSPASTDDFYSVSGLDNYPTKGSEMSCWIRMEGADDMSGFMFGMPSSTERSGYYVHINMVDSEDWDQLRMWEMQDGSAAVLDADIVSGGIAEDTWYEITVTWADGSEDGWSEDDIFAQLWTQGGADIASVYSNNNTYADAHGVGVHTRHNSEPTYYDALQTTVDDESPAPPTNLDVIIQG